MGVAQHWRHRGILVGATVVGGTTAEDVDVQAEILNEPTSGESHAQFIAITGERPRGDFTTLNVAKMLAICGVEGINLATVAPGAAFFGARFGQGKSVPDPGNVHRKYAFLLGGIFPNVLSVDHGGNASLTCNLISVSSDGVVAPLIVSENVALPAGLNDSERFGLGKISLFSNVYNGATSVQVNFGLGIETKGSGGDLYDTLVFVGPIAPTVVIRGINPEWVGTAAGQTPIVGRPLLHANTTIYFRAREDQKTFFSDATAKHMKITLNGLVVPTKVIASSGTQPGECELTITGKHDGTNSPFVLSIDQTIT